MGEGERSLEAGTVAERMLQYQKKETGGSAAEGGTRGYTSADEPSMHENTRHTGGERIIALVFYI